MKIEDEGRGRGRFSCRFADWLLVLLASWGWFAASAPAGEQTLAQKLYATASRAGFEVLVDERLAGSGWFADTQGLGFTAAHVVERPGRKVEVMSLEAGRLAAAVVAVDRGHDLALLKVEARQGGYPVLPLAQEAPPVGQEVYLYSASLFRHGLLQRGMVAREGAGFEYYAEPPGYVRVMHLAATVQGSSSGGPWLSPQGQVVGVQSGAMSLSGAPVGVAYMGPAEAVRKLLQTRQTAATPTIGAAVEETWEQEHAFWERFPPRTEGLVAKVLQADGPAARAGLKQWDVITAAAGQKVRLRDELLRLVWAMQPGHTLLLNVLRPDGAGTAELPVVLGKLEAGWP
jgi:S1-C subfamily serine protease